jgi:hypothetical protein
METITQEEFNRHVLVHGHPKLHEERAWFRLGDVLGAVVFDKKDSDWSIVALMPDTAGVYRFVDGEVSFLSQEGATAALKRMTAELHQTPPPAQAAATDKDRAFWAEKTANVDESLANGKDVYIESGKWIREYLRTRRG